MYEVLRGYTVGVTAEHRAAEQIALLEGRGAECIHGPTARISTPVCEESISAATAAVIDRPPTAVVALTALGVQGWFEVADAAGRSAELQAALATTRVFVRGPEAHGAAIAAEVDVEWGASTESPDELGAHLCRTLARDASVVVLSDGGQSRTLIELLHGAGFAVRVVDIYRWQRVEELGPPEALVRAIAERRADAVTFMSAPAVDHLVQIAETIGLLPAVKSAFAHQVVPVCVGPVSAARAVAAGLGEPVVPDRARLGSMVQRVTEVLGARSAMLELAGCQIELRGRLVRIDGGVPIRLTVRERAVLVALLERPGVVRSKTQLLDTVWGGDEVSVHVVEVTVARLRRRLGLAGVGIETVIRRGYRARTT